MSGYVLATMVEGHGEVDAFPLLIRMRYPTFIVPRPVRVKRQQINQPEELIRTAKIAESNIREGGGIGGLLLLLDADNECAALFGPKLQQQLCQALEHRLVRVVLAVQEYESWLVAGDPTSPESPDETRGGKGWLKRKYGQYKPTADQPRLTRSMNIERAGRVSRSFQRLNRVLEEFAIAEAAQRGISQAP